MDVKTENNTTVSMSKDSIIEAIENVLGKKVISVKWEYEPIDHGNPTSMVVIRGVKVEVKD